MTLDRPWSKHSLGSSANRRANKANDKQDAKMGKMGLN
jgi:hypothetical protein